ncbi:MAG: AraC family transcriptional regulator [Verrucomicrobiales bacterium]|nr:AraC family transcriptional regulator [Verrucomicrobiales bacterium]
MNELQSILLEQVEISSPDFTLRRVALNQHMPRVEKLSEHVHDYHQWLVYLRGHGRQYLEEETVTVGRGTVLAIQEGWRHRFVNDSRVRPVCLVIDFESTGPVLSRGVSMLSAEELLEIEKLLVSLNEEERKKAPGPIMTASLLFQIMALIECALSKGGSSSTKGPVTAKVTQSIKRIGVVDSSPHEIAGVLGCSLDHLNRSLKNECGRTVGDLLNEARLEACSGLLKTTTLSIGEIGTRIGIDDQNYFARWFRKQTGHTPSQWRVLRQEI